MIDPGTLNKRITLQRPSGHHNGVEYVDDGVVVVGKVWADVYWVTDSERYAAGAIGVDATLRVIIRKRVVDHDWTFTHEGQTFAITGIKPLIKDVGFIELSASLVRG